LNYKIACELYRSRYQRQAIKRKEPVPKLSDREILLELSLVQKELSETYRLSQKTQFLNLVAGQYKYIVGTGTSNIKADILDIDTIIVSPVVREAVVTTIVTPGEGGGGYGTDYGEDYGGGGGGDVTTEVTTYIEPGVNGVSGQPKFLIRSSLGDMGNEMRSSGLPSRYYYHDDDDNSELWIDSLPGDYSTDPTSRLYISYNQKMYLLFDSDDNSNTTWSDYDETANGYGGSFKIPSQFHSLIIDGALANAFPELMNNYLAKARQMIRSKPVSVSGKLRYQLGNL
jgi:hypothetical protein